MGHYACIAIGINHYQFLAPLNYGQADAYKIRQFLVNQANLPPEQFLLLSDTSPLVDNFSTYPTQENIWRHLEVDPKTSWHSAQYRWFFFSGYGVSLDGVDYLMPIDGNPHDIPGTAIPMRSLLTTLKDSGNENLLVLLDINRSPGLQAGAVVGSETVALAHELNIALILSSQLDQFSHEAPELGNGLFTTALLEALRYYDTETTLANLDQYLSSYLPQLSHHHLRPIQNPLIVVPFDEARQQLVLPTVQNNSDFWLSTDSNLNYDSAESSNNGAATPSQKAAVTLSEERPKPPASTFPQKSPIFTEQEKPIFEISIGREVLLLAGGAVLVLFLTIAAILLNERQLFIGNKTATTKTEANISASPTTDKLAVVSSRLKSNQADLEQARSILSPSQASLFNQAITQARQVQPGDPLYPQARQDMARWSWVILDLAQGRAAEQNFSEAIATAKLVPDDDPNIYKTAQQTIANWQVMAQQSQQNQAIIQEAKQQLQSNQASSYRRAITILSKIPPNQAGYAEAEKLTEQWSRTIYLIAQSRASQGKLENAIATVALVPSGTSSSEAAQKAIIKWKQQR
jgi:Caspase domain